MSLVPKKGLEPPHPCEYMDLNHARLPIPPLRHGESGGDERHIDLPVMPFPLGLQMDCNTQLRFVESAAAKTFARIAGPSHRAANLRRWQYFPSTFCEKFPSRTIFLLPEEISCPSQNPISQPKFPCPSARNSGRLRTTSALPLRPSYRPPTCSASPRSTKPTASGSTSSIRPLATPPKSIARSAKSCAPTARSRNPSWPIASPVFGCYTHSRIAGGTPHVCQPILWAPRF